MEASTIKRNFTIHKSNVGFINPGSLMGPLPSKKLGPTDDITNDAQLLAQPRYLTTGRKCDPFFDQKALPRRGRRSLSTLTHFSLPTGRTS